MRVMVIGSKGMLGQEVIYELGRRNYAYFGFSHKDLDITDFNKVTEAVKKVRPDVVINCAGLVKGVTATETEFINVNAVGPINISAACDGTDCRLIQVSTDCVFSGKAGPYREDDAPDAKDIYGRSKMLGEIDRYPHLTVRTSFIGYGPRGLLNWAMHQKGVIQGYRDCWWNGLTSTEVARILVNLTENDGLYGILHLGNWRTINKAYLLELLKTTFNLPYTVQVVDAPEDMCGNKSLFSKRKNWELPTIERMVHDLKHIRTQRKMSLLYA